MTAAQELQVRTAAAAHLRGIPARQNVARIASLQDDLYTAGALAELASHFGREEIERCNQLAAA